MLKSLRFNLYAHRVTLPLLMALVAGVMVVNALQFDPEGPRNIQGYFFGSTVAYVLMMPSLLMTFSLTNMVRMALQFGQTRKSLAVDLAAINLVLTLALCAAFYAEGQLAALIATGAWMAVPARLTVGMGLAAWALASVGALIAMLGTRFGWRGWVGGFGALALAIVALVSGFVLGGLPAPLAEGLTWLMLAEGAAAMAVRFATAGVVWLVCHGAVGLLLRRYSAG